MMLRALLLSLSLFLLASCGGGETGGKDQENALRHGVAASDLTASLELRILEQPGQERTVGIVLRNPAGIPVQAVRAWVRFDPSVTHPHDFAIADPRFILFAPGEREVNLPEGFLKIGAALRVPVRDHEITLATFVVRVPPPTAQRRLLLAFHDWREDGEGHTAVLSISPRGIRNILQPPSALTL